jgi:lipopolysaccharide biosynthesis glycosyltransferase
MKICYLISKNYYELTLTSIGFIQKFYKGDEALEFYLFHFGDLDEVNSHHKTVRLENKDYPFFIHRCFLFDHFDEKIIFIDSDTVCQTNIKKLYDTNLNGNTLGAVVHKLLTTHKEAFKWYKPTKELESYITYDEWPFFNAGVMLVDCKKWKSSKFTNRVLDLFETYRGASYDYNDEVALNLLLGRDHCKFLDVRWNYNNHDEMKDRRPYIVHYYGDVKNI